MTETDLCYLSALQLRELYRKGEVSPVEVTEAVLRRMDQLNPKLNAFITMTPELALEGARRAEQAYQTDESPPPLAGIPTSIKDLVAMTGIRNTRGSLRYKDSVSDLMRRLLIGFTRPVPCCWARPIFLSLGGRGTQRTVSSVLPIIRGNTVVPLAVLAAVGQQRLPRGRSPCPRQRWRRFNSYSSEFLRYLRTQTLVGNHPAVSSQCCRIALPHRSDDADSRRCSAHVERHG